MIHIFIKKKAFQDTLFENVDIRLKSQHFYMLIAPSGTGKTTLFNMLIGEDQSFDGLIDYDGTVLNKETISEVRRSQLGILFQDFKLSDQMNAYDNVLLSATLSGMDLKDIDQKIKALFIALSIEDCLKKEIKYLSTGQKQRVAFARVMIKEPQFIICDEPTGNLDEENEKILMDYLKDYFYHHHCTILMATHNPALQKDATDILTIQNHHLTYVTQQEIKEETLNVPVKNDIHSLSSFYKTYFNHHILHYVILSLMTSLCMIGFFISFNFGYQTIRQVKEQFDHQKQFRTINAIANGDISARFSQEDIEGIENIEHVVSVSLSSEAFGRYGRDHLFQSFKVDDRLLCSETDDIVLHTKSSSVEDMNVHLVEGRNIENENEVLVSKEIASRFGQDILGKTLTIQLPFVGKWIDILGSDYGGYYYQDYDLVFVDASKTIVGVVEENQPLDHDALIDIYFDASYIQNTLEEVALPLENGNELSNQTTYAGIELLIDDGQHVLEVKEKIKEKYPRLTVSDGDPYASLKYIIQEKEIFTVVEVLSYIVIIYSIIEVFKLSYQKKRDYLHTIQLLGGNKKDIQQFFILESGLFIGFAILMTYILNTFALNGLNQYFLKQGFMGQILYFLPDLNFVYMDLKALIGSMMIHIILIIILQTHYYRKSMGRYSK